MNQGTGQIRSRVLSRQVIISFAIAIFLGLILSIKEYVSYAEIKTTKGLISGVVIGSETMGDHFQRVRYMFKVKGATYSGLESIHFYNEPWQVGGKIGVYYNALNPSQSTLNVENRKRLAIFEAVGSLLLSACLALYRFGVPALLSRQFSNKTSHHFDIEH
jgi:hypothetical protein